MASIWAGKPDPRPPKRVRASQGEWSDLHQLFEHAVCVHCAQRPVELHHITPKSQGGDDVAENLCPLCRTCHTKLEGHESGWERVASSVRVYVLTDRARCVYAVEKIGWERLSQRYPLLNEPEGSAAPGQPQTPTSGSLSDEWPERKSPWEIYEHPPGLW